MKQLLILFFVLGINTVFAQDEQPVSFNVSITDTAFIPSVMDNGNTVTLHFRNEGLNALISQYIIYSFKQ